MGNSERQLKEKISRVLVELGIPVNLQGFGYFKESIFIVIKNPDAIFRVTKNLYPKVAEVFDVKGSVVERCMRHASEVAFCKTGFRSINCFLGLDEKERLTYKPTNTEIIGLLAEILRMDYEENLAG